MSMPDELSLLSLFECEPKFLDTNIPYFYNKVKYEFCNICPSYSDIKIQVYSADDDELLSILDFKSVDGIEIISDKKEESKITIKIKYGLIKLNFKPRFKVFLNFENYP